MKAIARLAVLAVAPLLTASLWMDRQPSPKPYQTPVLSPPAGAVPVTGREPVSQHSEPKNPLPPDPASVARGKALFAVNCALCHGQTPAQPGPVGRKLAPPPPGLDPELVQERSDSHIYNAVTFGFGRMPPFKDKLSPRERWELVNYLRKRK